MLAGVLACRCWWKQVTFTDMGKIGELQICGICPEKSRYSRSLGPNMFNVCETQNQIFFKQTSGYANVKHERDSRLDIKTCKSLYKDENAGSKHGAQFPPSL